MQAWEAVYGPNLGYVLEMFERYQRDPNDVDPETRAYFDGIASQGGLSTLANLAAEPTTTSSNGARTARPEKVRAAGSLGAGAANGRDATETAQPVITRDLAIQIVLAARLARSIREYGHLAAAIDPLGGQRPGDPMLDPATHGITDENLSQLPATIVWPSAGPEAGTCLDAIHRLRAIYSGTIGYEFDHVQDYTERTWLHQIVEAGTFRQALPVERRKALLWRLTEVEGLEKFLHTVFVGQKRFSIEGNDTLIPILDELVNDAVQSGTREVVFGMAHRGRLNVLAHVLGKPYGALIAKFQRAGSDQHGPAQGSEAINSGWSGDVKYHLGAQRTVCEGDLVRVQLTMSDNPSHLEVVDPVVEGSARAAQEQRQEPGPPTQDVDAALAVTIHGDAAFPGEGVVAETLNLSRLPGYQIGGTVRIIVNNQIGFTTDAVSGRSTLYASDLAKGFEIPIVHVNADDAEACLSAISLAHAYRDRFHRDFLIDLVGYRRWGHNEGDEPSFTQPTQYATIASHPTVRALYADRLIGEGVVTAEQVDEMVKEVATRLRTARDEASERTEVDTTAPVWRRVPLDDIGTAVGAERLRELNAALLEVPEGFKPISKLERQMTRRRETLDQPGHIDWALAESLAFASILSDGIPIRFTGQDTQRGTFSQRHLVLHDAATGVETTALENLPQARASFAVYNSPLTESATIGFEYGYSVHAPECLVLWEAQFGDFANMGQVLIDQFLVAARAKWQQQPALVLLLPHGYEGQGPEHSSARPERYLQLAAEDNIRIANCTTAAQYFHLLRVQAATLQSDRRPLILMTPKSLLRHPLAASSLSDLSDGRFFPILEEAIEDNQRIERLVFCSGKVAVDLETSRRQGEGSDRVAVARVELLYPFPDREISRTIERYPNLREVAWVQEEPRNMGAWNYIAPRLQPKLPRDMALRYLGRPERASTAEGSPDAHAREQARIVREVFASEGVRIETQGAHDVS